VLGDVAGIALLGAAIEPGVTVDTRGGPIVLEAGVEVRGGTRLEGPLWAGPHARLLGGRIATSAIGPAAVVHGEMVASVLLGYANKSHDGFVGHSVLGRWVNLGAGTTTSNLKNTYGPVRLTLGSTAIDTGARNLGSLIGDHAKIAIGTLLSAGTVIGTGANVFDAVRAPRYVAPFAWGGSGPERVNCEGFLRVAERVLPRRGVAVSDATRALLARVHAWATAG
jgi:UDP-N-acetylglucosamine diphosphorylase/glucosamine-1-phosphate N-acetyltransferase